MTGTLFSSITAYISASASFTVNWLATGLAVDVIVRLQCLRHSSILRSKVYDCLVCSPFRAVPLGCDVRAHIGFSSIHVKLFVRISLSAITYDQP